MLAQSIGEYGAASSLGASVASLTYSAGLWFSSISPTTWVMIAVVVIGIVVWSRR